MLIFSTTHQLLNTTLHMHKNTQSSQIIYSAMAQIAPPHTQTHTLVVLSLLLVLTAHQSPVSACRNMLTPAISLKSLSIRGSCAGPSTPCKPWYETRPHTHARLELAHRHPHVCTQIRENTVCLHTYAYTLLA